MNYQDYYKVLGVPKTATEKEIKSAYRKLARQFHPDLNKGDKKAEARFKEVGEANEVLSDPEKRKRYDELGANWQAYERAGRGGGPQGWPGGGNVRVEFGEELGGFSDFFKTFFAGGGFSGAGFGSGPGQGSDVEAELEVMLEEVLKGTKRTLQLGERKVEVKVPPGVRDGSRLRVAGEGAAGPRGGPKGDLYLRVVVRPHPQFERRGDDLVTSVKLPLTTALLGGEMTVPTLDGSLSVKVPAGTAAGQTFRLRGQGLPEISHADHRGDLLATVAIELPKKLTHRQKELFEEIRESGL
ncbi:MAG TPA: DnaJ C-terminal domain-containing protein [Vicinamibacteria bacterium]